MTSGDESEQSNRQCHVLYSKSINIYNIIIKSTNPLEIYAYNAPMVQNDNAAAAQSERKRGPLARSVSM